MILTIQIGERSYRLVTAQTAVMRFSSCKDSADQARFGMIPGAFSYGRGRWETSVCRSRRVHRSANPAFPGHQNSSCGSGPSKGLLPMSKAAYGATVTRLFDPNKNTHFALSEDAKYELDNLFSALAALHQVMDTQPDEVGPEIAPHQIAPLFATFAAHGRRIMDDLPCQFPGRRTRA